MKRAFICVISLILCVFAVTGCAKVGGFDINKKIVCEVGGEPVTYDEYKYFFYGHHMEQFGTEQTDMSAEDFAKIKALTEDSLKRRYVIMSFIDEYGVKLTKEDKKYADEACEAQIELFEGEEEFFDYLLDGRATGNVFRDQVMLTFKYDPALRELFKTGVNKELDVSEKKMLSMINDEHMYCYNYAFFPITEGKNSLDVEKAAKAFHEGVVSGTQSFTKSECDMIGQRPLDYEEKILALSESAISDVTFSTEWSEDYAGYWVFQRVPIDRENVIRNIEKYDLENEFVATEYLAYIKEKSKSVKVEYAKYFESIDYATLLKRETLDQ